MYKAPTPRHQRSWRDEHEWQEPMPVKQRFQSLALILFLLGALIMGSIEAAPAEHDHETDSLCLKGDTATNKFCPQN